MSPVSKKRKRPQRRSNRRPSSLTIVEAMLAAFADRLDDDGPLQSELLLAYLLGASWGQAEWGRTNAAEALADEIVQANPTGHQAGGLALLTVARTGPSPVRERARQLLELGLSSGLVKWRMPAWADRVGTAELERTATLTDVYGDQTAYYFGFRYPGTANAEPHLLAVLVDYNLHLIKDMFIRVGPGIFEALEQRGEDDDGATLAPMDPQAASDDVWFHLGITDQTIGEPFGEESAETRYVLEARLDRLPPPAADAGLVQEVPQAERDRVAKAFMRTAAVKELLSGRATEDPPPTRDAVRWIVDSALAYACDYGAGDPLRWSPMAVELFLTDWAPRKVNWEAEEVLWVPEVLDALVAYCGKKKGLAARWVEETRQAVAEYAGDFIALELKGTSKGPAAQLVASMLADGVDLTDEAAVQQWIDRHNDLL